MFAARFDDATTGRSVRLDEPIREIIAFELDDVPRAIEDAAQAARDGRWVGGYVAYEAAPAFDRALVAHGDDAHPLAWFGVFGAAHTSDETDEPLPAVGTYSVSRWTSLLAREDYDAAFARIRRHLEVGDTYQVNLTFPVQAAFSGPARGLYRDVFAAQEPAYGAHLRHGARHIVSVSPERFFAIDGRRLTTRPMKGTRARGRWVDEDRAAAEALASSEKDRAENVMIVDLIRNDLGRVAEFGSVAVDELFTIERYPTVWQMTSEISAELRPDAGLLDVFEALFPCGSVTGAPKARSMEIIAEVEGRPRGPYCGAIGYIPPGDGLDGASFSVAIRTIVVDDDEGFATYGVGGGVTWDSDSAGEYDEALAKAAVLTARRAPPSLIETMRWDGGWLWRDDHLDRMEASAEYFDIAMHRGDIDASLDALEPLLDGSSRVRIELMADGSCSVGIDALADPFAGSPGPNSDPLVLAVDHDPVDPSDHRLFHKIGDRSIYTARTRRHPEADEVILTNTDGMITEGTISNVAVMFDGRWYTPPVADGLLPGVMRAELLRDGVLHERSIPVAELPDAQAIAVFNSVRGWRHGAVAGQVAFTP